MAQKVSKTSVLRLSATLKALSLKMVLSKHKKQICNFLNQSEAYFLNYAISYLLIDNIHLEGTVSQIFYLGPSFYLTLKKGFF